MSALVECLAVVDLLARLIPRPSSWCSPVALDLGTSAGQHRHACTLVEILASTRTVRPLDVPTSQRRPPATQPAASALVECLAVVDALARLIPWPSSWCPPVALDLLASIATQPATSARWSISRPAGPRRLFCSWLKPVFRVSWLN